MFTREQILHWSEITERLKNDEVFVIEHKKGNISELYYCITAEQAEQMIDLFFQRKAKESDSFHEALKTQVFCDGMIFGVTKSLREKVAKDNLTDDKIHYLERFDYACSGVEFSFILKSENLKMRLSKYPFQLPI